MSRVIISRDLHRYSGFDPRSNEDLDYRKAVAEKVLAAAGEATTWLQYTRIDKIENVPVVKRSFSYKSRKYHGYVEIAFMSEPRPIYKLNASYSFGIDPCGNLYDLTHRRDLGFNQDIRFWIPMGDVVSCRYSTGVLEYYLIGYLRQLYAH
jgi:hypothetical protein